MLIVRSGVVVVEIHRGIAPLTGVLPVGAQVGPGDRGARRRPGSAGCPSGCHWHPSPPRPGPRRPASTPRRLRTYPAKSASMPLGMYGAGARVNVQLPTISASGGLPLASGSFSKDGAASSSASRGCWPGIDCGDQPWPRRTGAGSCGGRRVSPEFWAGCRKMALAAQLFRVRSASYHYDKPRATTHERLMVCDAEHAVDTVPHGSLAHPRGRGTPTPSSAAWVADAPSLLGCDSPVRRASRKPHTAKP